MVMGDIVGTQGKCTLWSKFRGFLEDKISPFCLFSNKQSGVEWSTQIPPFSPPLRARQPPKTLASDGHDTDDPKQCTANMTAFQARFQTMSDSIVSKIDEMGNRIEKLKDLRDLRAEMGVEGSPDFTTFGKLKTLAITRWVP